MSMKSFDCLCIGGSVLDTFVVLKKVMHRADPNNPEMRDLCFPLGTKVETKTIIQQSGGGASNASVTFARQRLKVGLISKLSTNSAGKIVVDELDAEGVATHLLIRDTEGHTGQAVIIVDPDGERTIFTDRGSAAALNPHDLAILDDVAARWVYITSINGSIEALDYIFDWASEHQIKIAWNPGLNDLKKHQSHVKRLIARCSFFMVNVDEAQQLLGVQDDVHGLGSLLHQFGAGRGIVTNGGRSACIIDNGHITSLEPHQIIAVDETGAGDAMGSGIVAGLLHGLPFADAAGLGLSNAEHVIMHVGAKTGIVYRK